MRGTCSSKRYISMQLQKFTLAAFCMHIMEQSHKVLLIVLSFSVKNVLSCCVCVLMFYIMLHCLHHVDFLRIVRSWISTNGLHWHMKKRSGDLHQHDADDDEGTLWRKDIENVFRWTQRTRWNAASVSALYAL